MRRNSGIDYFLSYTAGKAMVEEKNATHDYSANTYTVVHDTKYVLVSKEEKPFNTWRKERLQKRKELEEAMKEAEGAKLFLADVQSAYHIVVIKSGLKPRTVSLKGREDDMATSLSDITIVTADQENIFAVAVHQEKMEEKVSLLGVAAIGSCDSMHDILTRKHLVVDELVHHGCSRIVPVLIKRH